MATSQEQIKERVKEYFTIDKEIKDASKIMTQLRKKRKERETDILQWMRGNNAMRIKTRHGNLERSIQARKVTVNKERVQEVAVNFIGDETKALELIHLLYDERPVEETEVLKPMKKDGGGGGAEESTEN